MAGLKYTKLSADMERQILDDRRSGWKNPFAFRDDDCVRRRPNHDKPNLWRPAFVRDIEKVLHLPVYNRYADKTQVFSFYLNDDITRRALHVQLVSRIARNIGAVLGLNCDLIEAIALGHDIGHTPFGHAGERFLSDLLYASSGRYFNHNVHSVRVLDTIYCRNLTLQTLDGILCHNGEFELEHYSPRKNSDFGVFDGDVARCYAQKDAGAALVPSTLEGCVVRICDIIAYIGKDRQDAVRARIIEDEGEFQAGMIGNKNAQIINNLTVDIIEHSYKKDYIALSAEAFGDLAAAKRENYRIIYGNEKLDAEYQGVIKPMFADMFERIVDDVRRGNFDSEVYRHHIEPINAGRRFYTDEDYSGEDPFMIAADYIASMTDDYFIQLYARMFPSSPHTIEYKSYFEDLTKEESQL